MGQLAKYRPRKDGEGSRDKAKNISNLRRAGRSVVHGGRASLLLHKDGFPFLPAARWLGQVALRRLLPSRRLGQLPLLPIVISCGCQKKQCTKNHRQLHTLQHLRPGCGPSSRLWRLITGTHCIWFWSEGSSSRGTCRWRGWGWRGSGSTAASRTLYGRSLGSGLQGGRSGWWSDRFSLCICRREGRDTVVALLFTSAAHNLSVIHQSTRR